MALEDLTGPAKFISNLVAANPTADDFEDEGDDHIRGIKNVLRNTFPAADHDVMRDLLGMVAPFSYAPVRGWLLCDGRVVNQVDYPRLFAALGVVGSSMPLPDLRGYFIRGRDFTGARDPDGDRSDFTIAQSDSMTSHNHAFSDPGHVHNVPGGATIGGQSEGYTTPGTNSKGAQNTASVVTGASIGGISTFMTIGVGPNKILNPDFSSGANWTLAGATISGGRLNTPAASNAAQGGILIVPGRQYYFQVELPTPASLNRVLFGSALGAGDLYASAPYSGSLFAASIVFPPGSPTNVWLTLANGAGSSASSQWDNVVLYDQNVPGTGLSWETRPRNIALGYYMFVGG